MAIELPNTSLGRALRLVRLNGRAKATIQFLRERNQNDLADAVAEICNEWMEKQNAVDVVEAAHVYRHEVKEQQS